LGREDFSTKKNLCMQSIFIELKRHWREKQRGQVDHWIEEDEVRWQRGAKNEDAEILRHQVELYFFLWFFVSKRLD